LNALGWFRMRRRRRGKKRKEIGYDEKLIFFC
jgi:hypothetical protein